MNQEFNNQDNQTQTRNRFIFSDDFYDQLDKIPEEKPVSFDSPQIPVMNETISQNIPTDNNNLVSSSNIINPVNEDSNLINKEMSSTNQEEKVKRLITVTKWTILPGRVSPKWLLATSLQVDRLPATSCSKQISGAGSTLQQQ